MPLPSTSRSRSIAAALRGIDFLSLRDLDDGELHAWLAGTHVRPGPMPGSHEVMAAAADAGAS